MFARSWLNAARIRWVLVVAVTAVVLGLFSAVQATPARAKAPAASSSSTTADVNSVPDIASAQAAAAREGHQVEATDERTETATTYVNPDGTLTTTIAATPIRVHKGTDWKPVDTSLSVQNGRLVPAAVPYSASLSNGGTGLLLSSQGDSGEAFGLAWPSNLPTPDVSGSVATYHNVSDGVDLVVSAQSTGFDVAFSLTKRPSVAPTLQLPLKLTHLTAAMDSLGDFNAKDSAGTNVVHSPAPQMWDASSNGSDPASVHEVSTTLDATGSGTVNLKPSWSYLSDPNTTYPVTIDPTYGLSEYWDTWISQANPDTNYDASQWFRLGGGSTASRSLLKFGFPNSLVGTHILSATLGVYNDTAQTCTAEPVNVRIINQGWNPSTVTWNNQPALTQLNYDQTSFSHGYSGCSAAWQNIPVTDIATKWAAQTVANNGIELQAGDETNSLQYKTFRSSDYQNTATYTPTLSVHYNSYPTTVAGRSMSPFATLDPNGSPTTNWTSSLTPTFHGGATDPDGGTNRMHVEVTDQSTGSVVWSGDSAYVPAGVHALVTMPSGILVDGHAYSWHAKAYDGTDYSPNWSSDFTFTVDATAPTTPTVSSSQYPSGSWTSTGGGGTFTVSSSDSVSAVGHYLYSLDDPTPATATANGATSISMAPMPDGWHTLYVAAVDRAGNVSATSSYSFGATPAVTSPSDGAVTQHSVLLNSRTAPGQSAVTYYYRRADSDSWTPIPAGDVTVTSSGNGLGSWPYSFSSGSGDSVPPSLTWNVASTLSSTDGPAQVAVCFGASCPTSAVSSLPSGSSTQPVKISLDTHAFNVADTSDIEPGSVNLLTGNFQLSEDDVSVPGNQDTSLSIGRTFNSATATGPSGIFGSGWTASLPVDSAGVDYTGLADTGSVLTATSSDGSTTSFAAASGGIYEPTGEDTDSGLTVVVNTADCASGHRCYEQDDLDGDRVIFQSVTTNPPTHGTLSSPVNYQVTKVVEPGSAVTTSFGYANGLVSRILAPVPSGATCTDPSSASTWTAGCRALDLSYDSNQHLTAVTYVTSDGSAPLNVDVACYDYNSSGQLADEWDPRDIATASSGSHPITCGSPVRPTHYTYDSSGRIATDTPSNGTNSLAGWAMAYDTNGRLSTVTRAHLDGSGPEVTTVRYAVPVAADSNNPSYRPDMTATTAADWAQTDVPDSSVGGTAVCPPGSTVPSDSSGDLRDCSVTYLDADGRAVNTADYAGTGAAGWHIGTTEYDALGNTVRSLTAANREEALDPTGAAGTAIGLPTDTAEAAMDLSTVDVYTPNSRDGQPDLTASYGPYHLAALSGGTVTPARQLTTNSYDDGTEPGHPTDDNGQPISYHLITDTKIGASLSADTVATGETDIRDTATRYYLTTGSTTDGTGWTYQQPMQTITDPAGLKITHTTLYDPATGRVTESRMPTDSDGSTAGTTKSIYYTVGTNSQDTDCGNKPLWDGLVCKTEPANLTPTSGLPSLVTTWTKTYDYLDRATDVDETATPSGGSAVTRTTATVYGFNSTITNGTSANPYATTTRQTAITGGTGTAVPAQTTSYNTDTGLVSGVSNGTVSDATSYDDFGRTTSYTDNTTATGGQVNTTTTNYDPTHGWVTETSDAHTTTDYSYDGGNEHRGLATGEDVTVAGSTAYTGSFTATYNANGDLVTQTDPNGVTIALTSDEAGQPTALVDTKSGAGWLADTAAFSIQGQWLSHSGPAGSQTYAHDAAGRLTQAADTPTAGTCTTRTYSYDADSNRLSSASYPAASDGTCTTSTNATTTNHTYDAADRLTDTGANYDAFGRTTTLPTAEVSGGADLGVDYYTNDLVHAQTQGTTTQTFTLDSEQRLAAWTTATGGITSANRTNHYDEAASDSANWVSEDADGSTWTANVLGINGDLGVTVDQTGTPTYQYADLHGDIAATAPAGAVSPTIASDYDEFGNLPAGTSTSRYGWLGSQQRSGDDLAGLVLMGVRVYDPTLGRFLQIDVVPGGSANNYDYAGQDPIDDFDPDGLEIEIIWAGSWETIVTPFGPDGLWATGPWRTQDEDTWFPWLWRRLQEQASLREYYRVRPVHFKDTRFSHHHVFHGWQHLRLIYTYTRYRFQNGVGYGGSWIHWRTTFTSSWFRDELWFRHEWISNR